MSFLNELDPTKEVKQTPVGSKLKNEVVENFTFTEVTKRETSGTNLIKMVAKSSDNRTVELEFWLSENSHKSVFSVFRFVTVLAQNTGDYNDQWTKHFNNIKANYSEDTLVNEIRMFLVNRPFYNMLVGQREFNGSSGLGTVGKVHVNKTFYGGNNKEATAKVLAFYNDQVEKNFAAITEKLRPEDYAPPANNGGFTSPTQTEGLPTQPPATSGDTDDLPF